MSILADIQSILTEARRATLGAALDGLAKSRARRREAAFSISLIALSAKMAKADGVATDDEFAAFQDFFAFRDVDASKVRMLYGLAQQDVAGFEHYAAKVAKLFDHDAVVLEDVLDCLFHVAAADGVAHPAELELLEKTAATFQISDASFRRIRAGHLGLGDEDPYAVLGIEPDADDEAVKAAYRDLVKAHHPDALTARGVPADLVKIAEGRVAAVNAAYEEVMRLRSET